MDLVHYNKQYFDEVVSEIEKVAAEFRVESSVSIPVSATEGDNITGSSVGMGWYTGKPLLAYLEEVDVAGGRKEEAGFVMPVQRVCRPNSNYRGFQGAGRVWEHFRIFGSYGTSYRRESYDKGHLQREYVRGNG